MKSATENTLYGAPLSLYTGKARSYLIKNRIPYRELTPTTEHFAKKVLPAARQATMPTLETADGRVIRDSTAIIDHFESPAGDPATPATACQRVISRLFDVIGSEGLLRPAMHYRWNFPDENLALLRFHFESLVPLNRDKAFADKGMNRMRQAAQNFGVTEDRFELIEALYLRLVERLDAHFGHSPYLLGGRACIGDFGLIAPMYGHLGRDPRPLSLLQSSAPRLLRWVERMNRPDVDAGEFGDIDSAFAPDDEVPDTLKAVLKQIAVDFVPETLAARGCINDWLRGQDDLPPGTPILRGVGMGSFEVDGTKMNALAQPYRFYLLSRMQAEFDAMPKDEQTRVERLLDECDLLPVLSARLEREIGRQDNLEVWL